MPRKTHKSAHEAPEVAGAGWSGILDRERERAEAVKAAGRNGQAADDLPIGERPLVPCQVCRGHGYEENSSSKLRTFCLSCAGTGRVCSAAGLAMLELLAATVNPQPKVTTDELEQHNLMVQERQEQELERRRAQLHAEAVEHEFQRLLSDNPDPSLTFAQLREQAEANVVEAQHRREAEIAERDRQRQAESEAAQARSRSRLQRIKAYLDWLLGENPAADPRERQRLRDLAESHVIEQDRKAANGGPTVSYGPGHIGRPRSGGAR